MRRVFGCVLLSACVFGRAESVALAERAPAARAEVVLFDAGVEPRQALRFSLGAGAAHEYSFTSAMSVTQRQGQFGRPAMQPPSRLPTILGSFTETVVAAPVGAPATVHTVVGGVGLGEPLEGEVAAARDALGSRVKGMVGLTLSSQVEPDGTRTPAVGADFEPGSAADTYRGFTLALEQFHCPFPAEPIGVGARWTVRRTGMINGVLTDWVNTAEVVALDADTVTLRVEHTHALIDGLPVKQDGAPPGVEITTVAIDGAGVGTLVYSLSSPTPIRAEITVRSLNGLVFKSAAAGENKIESEVTTEFALDSD